MVGCSNLYQLKSNVKNGNCTCTTLTPSMRLAHFKQSASSKIKDLMNEHNLKAFAAFCIRSCGKNIPNKLLLIPWSDMVSHKKNAAQFGVKDLFATLQDMLTLLSRFDF